MLEIRQPIKSIPYFNVTFFQKVVGFEPQSINHNDREGLSGFADKRSNFLLPLLRKKRADDETKLLPFSQQLTWDNALQLTWYGNAIAEKITPTIFTERLHQLFQTDIRDFNPLSENWLTEKAYPTDYELGCLSLLVYKEAGGYAVIKASGGNIELNKGKKRLEGWLLIGVASHPQIGNGYFGAIYWHAANKHLVIAHRGTKPSNLGSVWADIKGIWANKEVAQQNSAVTFSHLVLEALPEEVKSISFTGHSLGGWLAQITTFTSEYIERSGNSFKKREKAIYHPHTVVFDSPGCQPMLWKLKGKFDLRYVSVRRQELNIHALDIRIYLSAPNMVNTYNQHIGEIYRLFPDLTNIEVVQEGSRSNWFSGFSDFKSALKNYITGKTFLYTVAAHNLKRILNAWPKDEDKPTGEELQIVLDWPVVSGLVKHTEYERFFSKTTRLNNYHITEDQIVTASGFIIRYRTKAVDFSSMSMCIFSANEREFLRLLKMLQDWFIEQKGLLTPDLKELVELNLFFRDKRLETSVVSDIMRSFQAYTLLDHGENLQTRQTSLPVFPLVNRLKQLLRRYPALFDVAKRAVEKRPALIQAVYSSEADHWINALRDQIDLRWSIHAKFLSIVSFLKDKKCKVLHITVESDEMKLVSNQLGYDMLMALADKETVFFQQLSAEEKVALQPYAHRAAVTFLNTEQVRLQQERGFTLDKFYRSEKSPPLLWLEGELNDVDTWQEALFNGPLEKKIVVLTKKGSKFYQFLKDKLSKIEIYRPYYIKRQLLWSDLTIESQQRVLERVTIQGKSLAKLIGVDNLINIPNFKLTELNKLLTFNILVRLVNNKVNIGSLPDRFAHLEAAYIELRGKLVSDKLKEILLKDFSKKETTRYLIITGFSSSDSNALKNDFVKRLGLETDGLETQVIKSKVAVFNNFDFEDKSIFIASDDFTEINFKTFCRDHNLLELSVDWIHWENNQFNLKYTYDPGFYINRKFKYKEKIVIKKEIQEKEVCIQVNADNLFIFIDIKFSERARFIKSIISILKRFVSTIDERGLEQFQTTEAIKQVAVTLLPQDAEKLFKNFNKVGSVHWLKKESDNQLVWQRSSGSLESLYSYTDEISTNNAQELLSEEDFIKRTHKKTTLIIDEPGMGKTTVLAKLAAPMQEFNLVIRINLMSHEKAIRFLPFVRTFQLSDVIEFLLAAEQLNLNSALAKNFLRYKLQHPKEGVPLLLLFDGFDEIKNDKTGSKTKVSLLLSFLKDKAIVWVTARKHEKAILQNSLLVFDSELEEFEVSAQKEFLRKFWYSRLFLTIPQNLGIFDRKCNIYSTRLLAGINNLLKLDGSRFMGIPLQLRLLAEAFQENFKEFFFDENMKLPELENISLLNLYESFVQVKYHIFLEKIGLSDRQDPSVHESIIKIKTKAHQRLAVYQLFGDVAASIISIKSPFVEEGSGNLFIINTEKLKDLFRIGLVKLNKDNNFEFIHKSFAEYFVAEFFVTRLKRKYLPYNLMESIQEVLLTNILIQPEYQLMRIFFDEFLGEIKIISDGALAENLLNSANILKELFSDASGAFFNDLHQTALHVAVEEQNQEIFNYLLSVFKTSPEDLVSLFSSRNLNGETVLYVAIKDGKEGYVKQLLGNINACSDDAKRNILLSTMFRTNNDESDPVIGKLLNYIEQYPELKRTASWIKYQWRLIPLFLESLERGTLYDWTNTVHIDPNIQTYLLLTRNERKATALHLALMGDYLGEAKRIIKQDVYIDAKAQYSLVPVYERDDHICRYEIEPSHTTTITPLQIAVSKRQTQVVEILVRRKAHVNVGQGDDTPLYMAAALNDEAIVAILLDAKVTNLNVQALTGETPIYWAAYHDNDDMLRRLLLRGADSNVPTSDGFTPLYWAVSHDNKPMVKALLQAGAEVNIGYGDTTPLYVAVRNLNEDIVQILLAKKAQIDIKGDNGVPLLWLAIKDNLEDKFQFEKANLETTHSLKKIILLLLFYGLDINTKYQNDETPLYWVLQNSDKEGTDEIASILIEQGADVNVHLPNGETPLYLAVRKNKLLLVEQLLHKGASANIEVIEHGVVSTPLTLARENRNEAIENILLKNGSLDTVIPDNAYNLYVAIKHDDQRLFKKLLGEGASVNILYGDKTLLHWAIQYARYEIVKILLDRQINVNAKMENGETPLNMALRYDFDAIASLLLDQKDVDINMPSKSGESPLYWAVRHMNVDLIKKLLEKNSIVDVLLPNGESPLYWALRNADQRAGGGIFDISIAWLFASRVNLEQLVNIRLQNAETLLYWAVRSNSNSFVSLLLHKGADPNAKLDNGDLPLYWALQNHNLHILESLLDSGADVNVLLPEDTTPLFYAIERGAIDIVRVLLDKDADVNKRLPNDYGKTPLSFAIEEGELGIVSALLKRNADIYAQLSDGEILYDWVMKGGNKLIQCIIANHHQGLITSSLLNAKECLDAMREPQSPGRSKRNALVKGCAMSLEDLGELIEGKEAAKEFSEIKINSKKLLYKLRSPTTAEKQRIQLLYLADKVTLIGKLKGAVTDLINNQKKLMFLWKLAYLHTVNSLQKVGYVSSLTMYGMMTKNLLSDLLKGNWEGIAINLGFIAGGRGFAKLAEVMSLQGMAMLSSKKLLGQSLRLASPFLARGTSALIVYDLANQIKAYQAGNPDAIPGLIGDSIYLGVDAVEAGIEVAEIAGVLEGVSSVTGPIGITIGAVVFVTTDIYSAVRQVVQIDSLIHLSSSEKVVEGLRAFIGLSPEEYLTKLLEEKQGNNQLFAQGIAYLKNNTNIQRYIIPATVQRCYIKEKLCNLQTHLDNQIFLDHKRKHFRWSRVKPDVSEGNLFCTPAGDYEEVPAEGAYFCDGAMGIEYSESRTGNITLIDLGDGNDTVSIPYGEHIVKLGSGYKNISLGDGDDIFILNSKEISGVVNAGGGTNTLSLGSFSQVAGFIYMYVYTQLRQLGALKTASLVLSERTGNIAARYSLAIYKVTNLSLRQNKGDKLLLHSNEIHYVDGRGGENEFTYDLIGINDCYDGKHISYCPYTLTLILRAYTDIVNNAKNGKFTYIIRSGEEGSGYVSITSNYTHNRFFFDYTLYDVSLLERSDNVFYLGFTTAFSKKLNNTDSKPEYFLTVSDRNADKHLYQLSDGTQVKVGVRGKFYAFQSTNSSVEAIIKDYPRIAERLRLSIFAQSLLSNESVSIGHGSYDVLTNDPYRRSHLVGNGGENIFVIRSGYEVLGNSNLPLPEVVLYDTDDQTLIDTLDLREIKKQADEDLDVDIQVIASLEGDDTLFKLFDSDLEIANLIISIRLKDTHLTHWTKRLHIILDHVLMQLDGLKLKPLPLEFGSNKNIIIINPYDLARNTTLVMARKLGDCHYYRLENSLVLTNAGNVNIADSDYYAIFLQDFYREPMLQTLFIQFSDKKLVLRDEMVKIMRAENFEWGYGRYRQTLYQMLFDKHIMEETQVALPRTARHMLHEWIEQEGKSVWGRINSHLLPLLGGIGTVLAIGLIGGYRYRNWRRNQFGVRAQSVVEQAAVVLPLLATPIRANLFDYFAYQTKNKNYLNDNDQLGNHSVFFKLNDCLKSAMLSGGNIGFCSLDKGERVIYWLEESESGLVKFQSYRRDAGVRNKYIFNYESKGEWKLDSEVIAVIPLEVFEQAALPELYREKLAYQRALASFRQRVGVGVSRYTGNILSLYTPLGDLLKWSGLSPDWSTRDDKHLISRIYSTVEQLLSENLFTTEKYLSLSAGLLEVGLLHPKVKCLHAKLSQEGDYFKFKLIVRLIGDVMQLGIYNIAYIARLLEYSFPQNEWMLKLAMGIQLANQFYLQTEDMSYWYFGVALCVLPYIPNALESMGIPVTRGMQSLCNKLIQIFIGQSLLNFLPEDKARVKQSQRELSLADQRVKNSFSNQIFSFFKARNDQSYQQHDEDNSDSFSKQQYGVGNMYLSS